MKTRKTVAPRFASRANASGYPASLEVHKIYRVLPNKDAEQDGGLRVVDKSGEGYLYPADYFVVIEVPREAARTLNNSLVRSVQPAT